MEQTANLKQPCGHAAEHGVPHSCATISRKDPVDADTREWFPMRVTYNRELKVKSCLDALGIENFLPMQYKIIEDRKGRRMQHVPAIHNLLFIHSDEATLTTLKRTQRGLEPLRYMTRPLAGVPGVKEIIRVPKLQMENFMRVATIEDERVMFLDYNDFIARPGRKVRITEGVFAGVEGVVKRIKNNRHVVVQIEGVAAVAITYVPANCLTAVEEEGESER